jgi:hypothetical protein
VGTANKTEKGLPVKKVPHLMGCLTGFEPVIDDPQSSVLPLHHRHHLISYAVFTAG